MTAPARKDRHAGHVTVRIGILTYRRPAPARHHPRPHRRPRSGRRRPTRGGRPPSTSWSWTTTPQRPRATTSRPRARSLSTTSSSRSPASRRPGTAPCRSRRTSTCSFIDDDEIPTDRWLLPWSRCGSSAAGCGGRTRPATLRGGALAMDPRRWVLRSADVSDGDTRACRCHQQPAARPEPGACARRPVRPVPGPARRFGHPVHLDPEPHRRRDPVVSRVIRGRHRAGRSFDDPLGPAPSLLARDHHGRRGGGSRRHPRGAAPCAGHRGCSRSCPGRDRLSRAGYGVVRRSVAHEARGMRAAARGAGRFVGAFGHRYVEYKRTGT